MNAAPENIANLEAPEAGQTFRATVDEAAKSFTITNTRTNETRSFAVRRAAHMGSSALGP